MNSTIPASEEQFLEIIDSHFPNNHRHMPLGRGDDCAELAFPARAVVTTDLFIENIHFRRDYFSPGDIGHKALAVNISDIAGMGCAPLGFSLGLMVPSSNAPDTGYWNELFAGMAALAAQHDIPLTGGDLSQAPVLGLSVTIWGAPEPHAKVLKRQTCSPGDVILCIGDFGLVRTGLYAMEHDGNAAAEVYPQAAAAHRRPTPQVAQGLALSKAGLATACMDLSDGLARDLPRLLGTNLGAALTIDPASLHPETTAYCKSHGIDPVHFAYLGGEDYALLATVPAHKRDDALKRIPEAQAIGTVTETSGILLNGAEPTAPGFDHFSHNQES